MQEEYTNDKKLCEWLRANSSGIYRLTGFAADKIEQLKEELEALRAENAKLIDFWAKRAGEAERKQYENHDVYATLYEDAKALIDPHTKASGGELPTSVIQSFEYLFKFWIQHKAEREAMMKQEPYRYFNEYNMTSVSVDQWKNSKDFQSYYELPLYRHPLPAQQVGKLYENK